MAASLVVRIGVDASSYKSGLSDAEREAKKFAAESARVYKEAEKAAETSAAKATGYYVKSAKEQAAALRTVPAQFTDIAVSLQAGQNPLTVLLQQGGQLKDQFGGIGNAAKAMGGYIVSLINPITVVAAGAAGVAFAFNQASKEAQALSASIAATGNAAGTSKDQLTAMAESIDGVFGVTQGKGAEALAILNSTGKIASQNLEEFARIAIDSEQRLSIPIEKSAEAFAKLAKEPSKASKEYNDSLNYLTASIYKQILAAEELGQTEKAAAIAQTEYAKARERQNVKALEDLGSLQRGWNAVAKTAKEAWDAILNIGREDSLDKKIKEAEDNLARLNSGGAVNPNYKKQIEAEQLKLDSLNEQKRLIDRNAAAEGERVAKEKAGIIEVDKQHKASIEARKEAEKAAAKEREDFIKDQRRVAIEAGDAVNKANEEYNKELEKILSGTKTGKKDQLKEDIETLNEALRIGRIDATEYAEAVQYVNEKFQKSSELANGLGLTFSSAFEDAIVSGKGFGDILKSIEQDVLRLIIRLQITKPLADSITKSLGGVSINSLFGGGQANIGTVTATAGSYDNPSFAGGGYTGAGSRSGGLDGQGGFMAMLHPNETVVDHAMGQGLGGGGGAVTVNVINQGSQMQVTGQSSRQNSDGSTTIDVMIAAVESGLADRMGAGVGSLFQATNSRFVPQGAM